MEDLISRLHAYLMSNGHTQDASSVEAILSELLKTGCLSDASKDRLATMCSPKYLGDLYIKEFTDPYAWWNFLAEIKGRTVSDTQL